MSKVKYRVREFTPKANQAGSHSFFAEVVVNNELDNNELAKRIAARTGFKSYECQAIVAAVLGFFGHLYWVSGFVSL